MRSGKSVTSLAMFAAIGIGLSEPADASARADEGRRTAVVQVLETPDGGIQPQAAIDDRGVIHLVFFKGEPSGGDLFYCRLQPGAAGFSPPVRVNSQPGSAIAIGTIRGGQIAVGKGGRIHVAWNGSNGARPKNPAGSNPMLYTRSDPTAKAFEPQRNLMQRTSALDGGGTIAADREGNVYVAWHGRTEDAGPGEAARRMWVVRSKDDGATFSAEEPALESETGACGCCGTRALADHRGTLYLLYRAATGGVERGMYLLSSEDHAGHFRGASIHPWRAETCPMSSATMAEAGPGVLAAWETRGQVYFSRVDPQTHEASPPIAPPGGRGDRKHPAVAGNARGETILVWTEGTGWQKGGSLAWQVFDRVRAPERTVGTHQGWRAGLGPGDRRRRARRRVHDHHLPCPRRAGSSTTPRRSHWTAIGHPPASRRAARAQLDEARDIDEEVDAAHDLLRLDTEAARDAIAKYAARSPLRAFDRKHRVLLIIDGPEGEIHEVVVSKPRFIMGPGTPPDVAREIEAGMSRVASQIKTRTSLRIGKPPILWSAVLRLPDEAVTADEGGGGESVSFLLRPKDRADHVRLTFVFRGATLERSATYDVTDAQLRRWRRTPGGRRIGDDGEHTRSSRRTVGERGGPYLAFVVLASRDRMRPRGSWRTIRIEEAGRCGQGSRCRVW